MPADGFSRSGLAHAALPAHTTNGSQAGVRHFPLLTSAVAMDNYTFEAMKPFPIDQRKAVRYCRSWLSADSDFTVCWFDKLSTS
mgnify:CR=1 FL=1